MDQIDQNAVVTVFYIDCRPFIGVIQAFIGLRAKISGEKNFYLARAFVRVAVPLYGQIVEFFITFLQLPFVVYIIRSTHIF